MPTPKNVLVKLNFSRWNSAKFRKFSPGCGGQFFGMWGKASQGVGMAAFPGEVHPGGKIYPKGWEIPTIGCHHTHIKAALSFQGPKFLKRPWEQEKKKIRLNPSERIFCPDQNVCLETHEITDKIRLKSLRIDLYPDKKCPGTDKITDKIRLTPSEMTFCPHEKVLPWDRLRKRSKQVKPFRVCPDKNALRKIKLIKSG